MDYRNADIPNVLYAFGSLCFLVGTIINMWRN